MTSSTLTPIPEAESDWARPTAAVRQILIVDDSDYDVSLIRTILEPAGFSVIDFQSGRLGLQAINERAFDLVILDLRMPDVDGFDILEAIRYQTPKPQVLAVSGVMQPGLLAAAKALGASAVLDKHSLADALLPTIRTLLDNKSSAATASPAGQIGSSARTE